MKIGILTYHAPCNFGANLQAYSSVCFFKELGHEVKVINYLRKGDINPTYCNAIQREGHSRFCQDRLPITRIANSENILEVVAEEQFDIIAIGADAVWNKGNRKDLEVFYAKWLWESDFSPSIKVICLSPAFMGQTYSDLTDKEKASFKNGLEHFWRVNARDSWTMQVVNNEIMYYDYIKTQNPDPVFLLNRFCKDKWIHDPSIVSKQYILVSFPDKYFVTGGAFVKFLKKKWALVLKKQVNNRNLKLIELPIPEGLSEIKCDYIVPYPIDPLQWYLWIKNSRGFIGLRFHAIVSCLSCGTPFFSLDSYGAVSNKFVKLLNLFGLHIHDSKYNTRSKIRNLIQGSGLEDYRVNGTNIFLMSPRKLLNKLERFNKKKAEAFVNDQISKFTSNMMEAINSINEKDEV